MRAAVDGTERVIRAAATARVARVVVTASVASVGGGQPAGSQRGSTAELAFTGDDWTVCENLTSADSYTLSKTVAGRRAGRQSIRVAAMRQ